MNNSIIQKQTGFALVEVVITMVVVALGLMAVATFQSDLMSGSGNNKIRSEALALAEQKIEELRNNIEVGTLADVDVAECIGANDGITSGYRGICPSDSGSEVVGGTNASFTRAWTITNTTAFLGSAPARRNLSVQVSWDSDGGADGDGDGNSLDDDERVIVVSEMAWINPADSALYSSQSGGTGTGKVPSPRQEASEDVASEKVIGSDLDIISGATTNGAPTSGEAGVDALLDVNAPNPSGSGTTSISLSQVAADSHYYTAIRDSSNVVLNQIEEGVIAVFLCDDADDECTHIQNHFGGVVHRIKGTVYSESGNGLDDMQVAWSSSEVNSCYNLEGSGSPDSMEYECVFAGNCEKDISKCNAGFENSTSIAALIAERSVGPGGEYGEVGLLGVEEQGTGGNTREQICFLEDTGLPDDASNPLLLASGSEVLNEDYLFAVTKRSYVTRWFNDSDEQRSEGINQSFTNHDFLIIARGNGASANNKCHDAVTGTGAFLSHKFPPRQIVRTLNGVSDNIVKNESEYRGPAGEAEAYTGTITGTQKNLRLYIEEIGSCYINQDTGGDYACVVANGVTPTISGVSDEHPTAGSFATCTQSTNTTCLWPGDFN